ncbi:MAG: hypothetical protein QF926_14635 [Alphaproteobacteria bacterium]|jgi:hypothetical protein|nr:hypothetical protein [Alphaproteobacteria bacterium]MDP6517839.1 hypothetical protein [Alphaproteobacteria bacterium]
MATDKTRFVDPPNLLRRKTGGGPAGGGTIDDTALLAAQAVISAQAGDYPERAAKDIAALAEEHAKAVRDPTIRAEQIARIGMVVHDIRSEGSTFGYPLITKVGTSLYDFCQYAQASDAQIEVIGAHIDALRVIIGQKIEGDGGEIGAELLNMLRLASNKFQATIHK